jgi:hypothetical protein
VGIFKDIHLTSRDLTNALDEDSWFPKPVMYIIWTIVMFIYLVIIKFIIINTFTFIRKLFVKNEKA